MASKEFLVRSSSPFLNERTNSLLIFLSSDQSDNPICGVWVVL